MKARNGVLLAVAMVLILSGCNPVYKKKTVYTPPASEAGLLCVKSCNSDRQYCNSQCMDRYEQCKTGLSDEIQSLFNQRTQIYQTELDDYDRYSKISNDNYNAYLIEKTKYQNRLNLASAKCNHHNNEACIKAKAFEQTLDDLNNNFSEQLKKQQKPVKPNFAVISNKYISERCSRSCNCSSIYQQCYSQCGGRIMDEQVCIKNCKK
jgi:hypothetical protein